MNLTMHEEYLLFHYELGSTIGLWASVEHALAALATACVHPIEYNTVSSGFFGIENFRSKLEFVNRMVRSAAAERQEVLDEWDKLNARMKEGSSARNQIVHRTISIYENAPEGRRYALIEFPTFNKESSVAIITGSSKKPIAPASDAICLHQLSENQGRFYGLYHSLVNFRDVLQGQPKSLPESYEQGYAALSLRVLDTRFRAALGMPPRPSNRSRPAPGDEAAEIERQKMEEESKRAA
jgi:hypothetical protein